MGADTVQSQSDINPIVDKELRSVGIRQGLHFPCKRDKVPSREIAFTKLNGRGCD